MGWFYLSNVAKHALAFALLNDNSTREPAMKRLTIQLSLTAGLVALLAGCSSVPKGTYRPASSKEKQALATAFRAIYPNDVRADVQSFEKMQIAWVGEIKELEFREDDDAVQVAFLLDHRYFDWKEHPGDKPYHLSATGEGSFAAGWTVPKPTSISHLKKLAKPGYMLVVYGMPSGLRGETVRLEATAVRVIPEDKCYIGALEFGRK